LDNYDASVTDASFRLKRNYERCLLDYEQKRFPQHLETCKNTLISLQKDIYSSSSKSKTRTPPIRKNKIIGSSSRNSSRTSSPNIGRNASSGMEQFSVTSCLEMKTPLTIGDITIESFGSIFPRPPYVTYKNVFPIGFTSTREFNSMKDNEVMVKYVSLISDDGSKPLFVVTASDDPSNPVLGSSASRAWKTVYKRAFGDGANPKHISGNSMYGLNHPTVRKIIHELPNAREAILLMTPSLRKRKSKSIVDEDYDSSSSTGSFKAAKLESSSSSDDLSEYNRGRLVHSTSNSSLDYPLDDDLTDQSHMNSGELDDLEAAVKTLSSLKFIRS